MVVKMFFLVFWPICQNGLEFNKEYVSEKEYKCHLLLMDDGSFIYFDPGRFSDGKWDYSNDCEFLTLNSVIKGDRDIRQVASNYLEFKEVLVQPIGIHKIELIFDESHKIKMVPQDKWSERMKELIDFQ